MLSSRLMNHLQFSIGFVNHVPNPFLSQKIDEGKIEIRVTVESDEQFRKNTISKSKNKKKMENRIKSDRQKKKKKRTNKGKIVLILKQQFKLYIFCLTSGRKGMFRCVTQNS